MSDKGILDPDSVDPAISSYLEAWFKFRDDTGFVPWEIEEKIYSEKYNFAGRLDSLGPIKNKLTLVDITTATTIEIAKVIQLAAYMGAYNEDKPVKEKIKEREIVQLNDDGTYTLAPEGLFKKSDFSIFLSCLKLYNFKAEHGRLRYGK